MFSGYVLLLRCSISMFYLVVMCTSGVTKQSRTPISEGQSYLVREFFLYTAYRCACAVALRIERLNIERVGKYLMKLCSRTSHTPFRQIALAKVICPLRTMRRTRIRIFYSLYFTSVGWQVVGPPISRLYPTTSNASALWSCIFLRSAYVHTLSFPLPNC